MALLLLRDTSTTPEKPAWVLGTFDTDAGWTACETSEARSAAAVAAELGVMLGRRLEPPELDTALYDDGYEVSRGHEV